MKKFRSLSTSVALIVLVGLVSGCTNTKPAETKSVSQEAAKAEIYQRIEVITSPDEALKLLTEGNKRFTSNKPAIKDISTDRKKQLSSNGQHPFAVVVSCSDSRVPPEEVFDQALGDIFVVRDAGNVIDSLALGSVEYGAEHLHAPLIVVLGHESCGAVKATVDGGEAPGNINAIVSKIKPSSDKVKASSGSNAVKEDLYKHTEDENITNSIAEIKKSEIIKKLEEEKKVKIVGAKYHIETGEVTFTTGE